MIVGEISTLDDVWSIAGVLKKREVAGVLSKGDVVLVGDRLA